jgi:hypothetical protein
MLALGANDRNVVFTQLSVVVEWLARFSCSHFEGRMPEVSVPSRSPW